MLQEAKRRYEVAKFAKTVIPQQMKFILQARAPSDAPGS